MIMQAFVNYDGGRCFKRDLAFLLRFQTKQRLYIRSDLRRNSLDMEIATTVAVENLSRSYVLSSFSRSVERLAIHLTADQQVIEPLVFGSSVDRSLNV